jgi:hypothetical protein
MKPVRIQLSRRKGWKMPANTVKVDRSTKWGNPFIVGKDGTRDECVEYFIHMLGGKFMIVSTPGIDGCRDYRKHFRRNKRFLRGKNLACWCPLDKRCHADVLLVLANQSPTTLLKVRP